MCSAALDVSLRSAATCIIDDCGKVRLKRSMLSDVASLVYCLGALGKQIHPRGLETGTLTQHPIYGLREIGFDLVCMGVR